MLFSLYSIESNEHTVSSENIITGGPRLSEYYKIRHTPHKQKPWLKQGLQ